MFSEVYNRVGHIKGEISQVESRIAPLARLVEAPQKFDQAKQNLIGLIKQQTALTAELEKTDTLIAKVSRRITEVEARIASETVTASQTLIDTEGEFTFPESLSKLDMELRLSKTSLADLQKKRGAIITERQELPAKIRDAEGSFIHFRAVVAEIELHEQLMPVMDLFARAAVTRHQRVHSYDQNQFEIEIPRELIEPVEAALAAEIPRA